MTTRRVAQPFFRPPNTISTEGAPPFSRIVRKGGKQTASSFSALA